MKLFVDRLGESPEHFHFETAPGWWESRVLASREVDYAVAEPFGFDLDAHVMGAEIYLEGELRGEIEVECGRCLARYREPVVDSFRLVLEPAGDRVPNEPESAAALARHGLCLGDELEAGWYRGPELELDALFAEVVSLALPVQPLCRADCAGLCPVCGIDRNTARCDCEQRKPESPFAVLATLRTGRNGGEP